MSTTWRPPAVTPMAAHVLAELEAHRTKSTRPLFVALQGPQGSGKTFLAEHLQSTLTSPPHSLNVAVLSLDDLYLPHAELLSVQEAHPANKLLAGRGLPGTHDVRLGSQILDALQHINDPKIKLNGPHVNGINGLSNGTNGHTNGTNGYTNGVNGHATDDDRTVELPIFEKSLFDGEGDRLPQGNIISGPLDVVIFEGWCVGFCPTSEAEIQKRYHGPLPSDLEGLFDLSEYSVESVLEINNLLWEYVAWWDFFDVFIQIRPPADTPLSFIYKWRLQQEHNMKAKNGGKGMTDEQVKKFIDRYIPGYIFFENGVRQGYEREEKGDWKRILPPWIGHGLAVTINESREPVHEERF